MSDEVINEKEKLGAKQYSLFAQIFAALWVVVLTLLKGFKIMDMEISDIIYSGVAVAAIFCPVYFSIFLDKIKDIRFGK